MLDFPTNPNVGDTYERWEWDGTRWVCIPGGDGGPQMGVTDGSNAAPGEVGEFLSVAGSTSINLTTQPLPVGSLSLTAGDWDVGANLEGTLTFSVAGPTGSVASYVGDESDATNLNNLAYFAQVNALAITYRYALNVPPFRWIRSTNGSAILRGSYSIQGQAGSSAVTYWRIWARRMR